MPFYTLSNKMKNLLELFPYNSRIIADIIEGYSFYTAIDLQPFGMDI